MTVLGYLVFFCVGVWCGARSTMARWISIAQPLNDVIVYEGKSYWVIEHGDFSKSARVHTLMREPPP